MPAESGNDAASADFGQRRTGAAVEFGGEAEAREGTDLLGERIADVDVERDGRDVNGGRLRAWSFAWRRPATAVLMVVG